MINLHYVLYKRCPRKRSTCAFTYRHTRSHARLHTRAHTFTHAHTHTHTHTHCSGTTVDMFLRENMDWLSRATNWAKFSATAGLGVIHRSVCVYARVCARMHVCAWTRRYPQVCVYARVCARMHVCAWTRRHPQVCVCACWCAHACVCMD